MWNNPYGNQGGGGGNYPQMGIGGVPPATPYAPGAGAPTPPYAPGGGAPGTGGPSYGAPSFGGVPPATGYGAPAPSPYGGGPPSNGYGVPPAQGYGAPAQGYGTPPAQGYGAPAQGYGAPAQGYGAPAQGYGAPTPYGAPAPGGYGAPPAQGYGAPSPYGAQGSYDQRASGQKKAVLVGINYIRHQRGRLNGCINDVKNMNQFLTKRGFPSSCIRILTDDQQDPTKQPTKANILRDLRWLVQGAKPGDSFFFHFSGHGSQVADLNGDEDDGMDETILPVDYNTAGQIVDDLLHEILVAPLPAGCKLTSLMDCCHSGTGLDLPYTHNIGGNSNPQKKIKKKKKKKKKNKHYKNEVPGDLPGTSRADVYLYSGCRDDQTSADTSVQGQATGAMTWAFTTALSRNPRLSYYSILNEMLTILHSGPRKYTQVPQLSTGRRSDINQLFAI